MALPILDGNQTAATLSTIITGGAHIPAHTVVSLGSQAISDITSGVSGSVVSISNFPSTQTIVGTVTANGPHDIGGGMPPSAFLVMGIDDVSSMSPLNLDGDGRLRVKAEATTVTIGSLPAISGTVTANAIGYNYQEAAFTQIPIRFDGSDTNFVAIGPSVDPIPIPISGTVAVSNTVTIGSLPAISGTVTANNPNGALTTRFGSVTTANTAQITSAVTNTSRKYLLAQNISAGTVTIGIGFLPTTTQGIQLPAGGGLTFDAFCPTGAVYWLGAVTGAAYTILEG